MIVASLLRCQDCCLQFRFPLDREGQDREFYDRSYRQGMTTEMPNKKSLEALKNIAFSGTEKDFSRYIDVIRSCGVANGSRILDFGCSWGYGSWQFARVGFDTYGFEIAASRRKFAEEHLGVRVIDDLEAIASGPEEHKFDCVFSGHVLEHIARPRDVLELLPKLAKPGGVLIIVTPNGSEEFRRLSPAEWHRLWGLVHPNFIDERFYNCTFSGCPRVIATFPPSQKIFERVAREGGVEKGNLGRSELVIAAFNRPLRV